MNKFILFTCAIFSLTACNFYPGDKARTEELDVIVTQVRPDANFDGMTTYAITSKVKPVSQDPNTSSGFVLSDDFNDLIIATTKSNMHDLGWILVDSSQSPDFAIDLGLAFSQNTNVYGSYPGYGWGYPSYGWGYGWWSYPTVSTYEVSSLIFAGLDLNNVDTVNQTIPMLWNGLMQGPHVNNVDDPDARLVTDIDQIFEQSAYLKRK